MRRAAQQALEALDGMIADADGDLRHDLVAVVEHNRAFLTPPSLPSGG